MVFHLITILPEVENCSQNCSNGFYSALAPMKILCFFLLRTVLQSGNGKILIEHYGESVLKMELYRMRDYLEPKYFPHLEELAQLIDNKDDPTHRAPPLESDVPLSYRSSTSSNDCSRINSINTPSDIQKENLSDEIRIQQAASLDSHSINLNYDAYSSTNDTKERNLPIHYYLKWQTLIESDKYVLQSMETSLRNPSDPSELLSSCEFFTNILLQDFPTEIFLQRPTIVMELFSLVGSNSTRVSNAALNALYELTKLLRVRIHHSKDASFRNTKINMCDSQSSSSIKLGAGSVKQNRVSSNGDLVDNIEYFPGQLSIPVYCFTVLSRIFQYLCFKRNSIVDNELQISKAGINKCLVLLEEVFYLLCFCFEGVWTAKQNGNVLNLLKEFNDILIQYGDCLEYFRIESMLQSTPVYRITYLYLIKNITMVLQKLVPATKSCIIIPRNLRKELSNILLDVPLQNLYPEVYNALLNYSKNFQNHTESEFLKHDIVRKVCDGMTATVKFLKRYKWLSLAESLKLTKEVVPSIEFHENCQFVEVFIDICASNSSEVCENRELSSLVEDVILRLLTHNQLWIQKETYKTCHKKLLMNIGPRVNIGFGGTQITFFLSSNIFLNIVVSGMTSADNEIKQYAEDIFLYLIKYRITSSDVIWNKIVQALIPSLPLLICQIGEHQSPLHQVVTNLVDPSTENSIPKIVKLKCNIQFLFSKETYLREEAFSRICWLLTFQEKSRSLLPKLSMEPGTSLTNVFFPKSVLDINKSRFTDHFYQPLSLRHVIEVLYSENVEPLLRRSALSQISVMLEDPVLHQIFLDMNGIDLIVKIMKTALNDEDFRDYPDSVVPCVSILKNICLYHKHAREELGTNEDVLFCILRGLLLLVTEEAMRQDACILLCLLIFKDFIVGTPSSASFSLPNIICANLKLPFVCNTHYLNDYAGENLKDLIISDRWCLSSLKIHWNLALFGDFQELTKRNEINYSTEEINFSDELKLTNNDLKALKASSVHFCITECLNNIQNRIYQNTVIESIQYLTMFVNFYKILKYENDTIDDEIFLSHPWEKTFVMFFQNLPSLKDDILLLRNVLRFLRILVPFYTIPEKSSWIMSIVKQNHQFVSDLLYTGNKCEEYKMIHHELLKFITIGAAQEWNYLDRYKRDYRTELQPWTNIVKIVVDVLKLNDSQHFYNLVKDLLLPCPLWD